MLTVLHILNEFYVSTMLHTSVERNYCFRLELTKKELERNKIICCENDLIHWRYDKFIWGNKILCWGNDVGSWLNDLMREQHNWVFWYSAAKTVPANPSIFISFLQKMFPHDIFTFFQTINLIPVRYMPLCSLKIISWSLK